jgi:hypothetical protein
LPGTLAQAAFAAYDVPPPVKFTPGPPGARGTLLRSGGHYDCSPPRPSVSAVASGYSLWLAGPNPWEDATKPIIGARVLASNDGSLVDATIRAVVPLDTEGLALDVWFPYVIDSRRTYVLSVLAPVKRTVNGTIAGNGVHFILPKMALETNAGMILQVSSRPATTE